MFQTTISLEFMCLNWIRCNFDRDIMVISTFGKLCLLN